MTKTALKALTVAAVSAASILLGGGVASANPGDQPSDCQTGEEYQGEFGCVATQLPEETQGRAVDALPPVVQTPVDGSTSARPQPAVPAQTTAAPADDRGVLAPQATPGVDHTPATGTATPAGPDQPLWVSMDKIMQTLHALLGWLF